MGKIWFYMMSIGIIGSIITNNLGELNKVILNEASRGVEFAISLAGVMALWMGIMNIAKDSGLIDKIGIKLNPLMRKLFPSIPKGHKAMSYIVMNMALNIVGAGNGATAFGLMYFMQQGTPFIYQGQEIGMTNVKFDSIYDYIIFIHTNIIVF